MIINRRRGGVGALVVFGALVLAVAGTAPATAASARAGSPAASTVTEAGSGAGFGYLALGDSVAFGYRPPEVTPPADYLDAANFVGYPEVLGRLAHASVTNLSCPGETTGSMIDVTAQSNGCANSVGSPIGYRTEFPLHANYSGDQLDYAVQYLDAHRNTRLVSIDIGANDVFVCQTVNPDQCTGADFAATLRQATTNLATIYTALRDRAHYHGELVLVTYYSTNYADPTATAGIQALDGALATTTTAFGGVVADGFGAFAQAAKPFNGDTCAAGLLVKLPAGGCDVHPTPYGHLLLASAVAAAAAHLGRH